jgi:hypothetical protein
VDPGAGQGLVDSACGVKTSMNTRLLYSRLPTTYQYKIFASAKASSSNSWDYAPYPLFN